MKSIYPLALVLAALSALVGCSHLMPASSEQRIEAAKEKCTLIGFETGTNEHAQCALELEKSYQARATSSGGGMSSLCKWAIQDQDSTGVAVHCN